MSTWKQLFDEKFKFFTGGFIGGGLSGAIYLFGGAFPVLGFWHSVYVVAIKLIATFSFALAGAIGTALASPFLKWLGRRFKWLWRKIKKIFGKKKKYSNFGESFPPQNNNHKKSA